MLDLSGRAELPELMDDFSITDERLERALRELRYVNRYLGGARAVILELASLLRTRSLPELTILDLGTGIGDIPEVLVRWGADTGVRISVTAIDANPATVAYAGAFLDQRLPSELRDRIVLRHADVLSLEDGEATHDIVIASEFLHHFTDPQAVTVLRRMKHLSRRGIIVNDLHRHPAAYAGIRLISTAMPVSAMFAHDGPTSVRRGFKKDDLSRLARAAGFKDYRIRRRWAFRLVLSTVHANRI